jgi:hypothetical protein
VELSRIILDYIKALTWPIMLIAAFYFYGDKLFEIIKSREIDAFGVKIGKQIEEISKNYEDQISVLKQELNQSNTSQALLDKVQSIEINLDKQLTHIKSTAMFDPGSLVSLSKKEKVEHFERSGFEAILEKDVTTAIANFEDAEELWSDYHNVSEITTLLKNNKPKLSESDASEAWKNVIDTILKKYSWGMPKDIREEFEKFNAE